jgi:hypothetical protein
MAAKGHESLSERPLSYESNQSFRPRAATRAAAKQPLEIAPTNLVNSYHDVG